MASRNKAESDVVSASLRETQLKIAANLLTQGHFESAQANHKPQRHSFPLPEWISAGL